MFKLLFKAGKLLGVCRILYDAANREEVRLRPPGEPDHTSFL